MHRCLASGDVFTCTKFSGLSYHYGRAEDGGPEIDRSTMVFRHGDGLVTVAWTETNGDWSRKREEEIDCSIEDSDTIGQALFCVTATRTQGGGAGHGPHDVYPDGHHVTAVEVDGKGRMVAFYQSGSFVGVCEPDAVTVV